MQTTRIHNKPYHGEDLFQQGRGKRNKPPLSPDGCRAGGRIRRGYGHVTISLQSTPITRPGTIFLETNGSLEVIRLPERRWRWPTMDAGDRRIKTDPVLDGAGRRHRASRLGNRPLFQF